MTVAPSVSSGEKQASTFDPRKVQDKAFVKLFHALDVANRNLRPLAEEIERGRIRHDQDIFIVGGQGGPKIAITLWNLAYHHLAEGRLAKDQPFLLTFCTVCNSGMVFDPRVDGKTLKFRVGGVYRGTMIMCDTKTGSYWDHMTGECLGGAYRGTTLNILGSHQIAGAGDAVDADSALRVVVPHLSWFERLMTRFQNGHTWRNRPEGKFYPGFRASFVFDDRRRPEKELGLGVWLGDNARFYPLDELRRRQVVNDTLGATAVELTYDRDRGVPRARRVSDGLAVNSVFTRWYGFAQTFPGCEVYGSVADSRCEARSVDAGQDAQDLAGRI